MKRLVCHALGAADGLRVEEAPDLVVGQGEVLVRTTAANVAFVDRLIVRGEYQIKPALPFTPGVVAAGVVVDTGSDVDHLAPGTRVALLKTDYGAWATQVVVPAWAVAPIPDGVSDELAAASVEAYGTASYALEERGNLRPGEKALIFGVGGAVGTAALELALHLDAEVIAHTSDPSMWDASPERRPHHIIDRWANEDLRQVMREICPEGVDLAMDPVGGALTEPALRSLAPWGRLVVVGFASGSIASLPANFVLLNNRTVVGTEWGGWLKTRRDRVAPSLSVLLKRLESGVFRPPPPRLVPLADLPDVLGEQLPSSGLVRTVVVPG